LIRVKGAGKGNISATIIAVCIGFISQPVQKSRKAADLLKYAFIERI
jgi:hypothetical protein